jgi:hypothetical protein
MQDGRAAATDKQALAGARSGTSATLALVGVIPAVHLQRMRSIVKSKDAAEDLADGAGDDLPGSASVKLTEAPVR